MEDVARPSDRSLVDQALLGDRQAFAELVRRHQPSAQRLCRRLLGDAEAARDAVQEASLAAWLNLAQLHHPDRFGAWLSGIALNTSRRWLRASLSEERRTALSPMPEQAASPEEDVESAALQARVQLAVSELPRGQREAVYLFYLSGLTHREAAAELGVSVNALKARLHQGRRRLSHVLADLRTQTPEVRMPPTADFVPVHISDVRSTTHGGADRSGIVLLESADASDHLPIFIGLPEAIALAFSLENVEMPRPMTYQLAASLLEACGGKVTEVRITELAEYIYLATVVVETPVGVRETDARPSDALNMAVLAGAPISANRSILRVLDDMTWWNGLTSRAEFVQEVQERQQSQRQMLLEVRPDR